MRVIVKGKRDIISLLGQQHIKSVAYRLMKYLLRNQCGEGVLLHNTITGEMVLLNEDEERFIKELPVYQSSIVNDLIRGYYLVPVGFDEEAMVLNLRRVFKQLNAQEGINGYMILPTTDCNARCAYCFERDNRRVTMTPEMARRVVDYIVDHKGEGHIEIHWFGGEPLIGSQRIDQICSELNNREIHFISIMTSNGYLFTETVITKAVKEWNLKKVQITLDGTEGEYNRIKSFVNVHDSPYQRVLKNIHALTENGIHVTLRLNVDEDNFEDISILCNELCMEFSECDLVSIYASMVIKEAYAKPTDDPWRNKRILYERVCSLNERIQNLNKAAHCSSLLSLKYHACMADDKRAIIIHPDGMLSVCQHVRDTNAHGNIDSDEINKEKLDAMRKTMELDRCGECPIFPGCMQLEACPTTSNFDWYVCENTVRRENQEMTRAFKYRWTANDVNFSSDLDIEEKSC